MNSFVRVLKSAIGLIPVVYLFAALPVLAADECSKGQRLPLPPCVTYGSLTRGREGVRITNNCRFRVVVKVDIANSKDQMKTISPRSTVEVLTKGRYKLRCCPMLGPCRDTCPSRL